MENKVSLKMKLLINFAIFCVVSISISLIAISYKPEPYHPAITLSDFTGMTIEDLNEYAYMNGITINFSYVDSDHLEDTVIYQMPLANTVITKGSSIIVYLSNAIDYSYEGEYID